MAKDTTEPKINTVVDDGEAVAEAPDPAPMPMSPPEAEPRLPDVEPKKRTGLLRVTAKQYSQARGIRWERAAGFLFWANQKYGGGHRLTVPEWTQVHEVFSRTPVR